MPDARRPSVHRPESSIDPAVGARARRGGDRGTGRGLRSRTPCCSGPRSATARASWPKPRLARARTRVASPCGEPKREPPAQQRERRHRAAIRADWSDEQLQVPAARATQRTRPCVRGGGRIGFAACRRRSLDPPARRAATHRGGADSGDIRRTARQPPDRREGPEPRSRGRASSRGTGRRWKSSRTARPVPARCPRVTPAHPHRKLSLPEGRPRSRPRHHRRTDARRCRDPGSPRRRQAGLPGHARAVSRSCS